MSKSGLDIYGYEFTDPDAMIPFEFLPAVAPGSLGGTDPIAVLRFSSIYKLSLG